MVSECDRTLADLGGSEAHRYRVRGFVVDLQAERLLDPNEREVALRPRAFSVLRLLLLSDGRLIGREELMANVWGGVVVTDDSLVQAICDIRRAFGDNGHELIRTVRGRGYSLSRGMVAVACDEVSVKTPAADKPFRMRLRKTNELVGVLALCTILVLVCVLASHSRWLTGSNLASPDSIPVVTIVRFGEIWSDNEGGIFVENLSEDQFAELMNLSEIRLVDRHLRQELGSNTTAELRFPDKFHPAQFVDD